MRLKDGALQCVLAAKAHQQERRSQLEAQAELLAQLEVATGRQAQAEQLQAAAEQQLQHCQGELFCLPLGLLAECSASRLRFAGSCQVSAGRRCCGRGRACGSSMHLSQTWLPGTSHTAGSWTQHGWQHVLS